MKHKRNKRPLIWRFLDGLDAMGVVVAAIIVLAGGPGGYEREMLTFRQFMAVEIGGFLAGAFFALVGVKGVIQNGLLHWIQEIDYSLRQMQAASLRPRQRVPQDDEVDARAERGARRIAG